MCVVFFFFIAAGLTCVCFVEAWRLCLAPSAGCV
jgi:hypothetical protein